MPVCTLSVAATQQFPHTKRHTNVQQNCAILLLLDNVVLEDLVVQGLRRFHGRRHGGCGGFELWGIWEVLGGVIRGMAGADAN